jgi:hypothetical protein
MNSPDPTPPPALPPTPWYRSPVLVGIATAVSAQIIRRVQNKYHVDLAVFGINATDLASYALDTISAIGVSAAAYFRATSKIAPVTLTKPKAPPPPADK